MLGFVRLYADRAVQGQYVPAAPGWHENSNPHVPVALWQIMSHGSAVPMVSAEDSETATLRSVYEVDEATELVELQRDWGVRAAVLEQSDDIGGRSSGIIYFGLFCEVTDVGSDKGAVMVQ